MPLLPTEAALETTCERIARILTRQYGVQVRIEGALAYVDGERRQIVLPNLTDSQLTDLGSALDGFLDHECAHLIFTDFECTDKLGEPARGIWNSLEDAWVDRRMSDLYPGCGENLEILDERVAGRVRAAWDSVSFGSQLLYVIGRYARRAPVPEVGTQLHQVLDVIRPELEQAGSVDSTVAAVALAERIARLLLRDLPGPKRENFPEKMPPEKMPSVGAMAGDPRLEVVSQLVMGEAEALDGEWLVNDSRCDRKMAGAGDPLDYVVFSTEFDEDHVISFKDRLDYSKKYKELREEVADFIGSMSARLELALAAEAQSRWVGGERRGRRFDRRALPRWSMGLGDDRIFMRKESGSALDTAVSLLWDCSGSMGIAAEPRSKSALARLAAVAFHEALLRASVPHEVLGFNTQASAPSELTKRVREAGKRGEDLKIYSRLDEIDNRMVLVPFSGTDGRAICEISGSAANRDGECVLWAARRLAARPERRKILIVGSDGAPQGAIYEGTEQRYLRDVVRSVAASGIEIVGIGIMSRHVREYYPRAVVLRDLKDLPEIVMRELINLLTVGAEAHRGRAEATSGDD